jgi:hypothetical protein
VTDQPTNPLPTPCEAYRSASGQFDMGAFLDSTISLIECAVDEAKQLEGATGQLVVHALQLTNSHLRSALLAHRIYVSPPEQPKP